MFTFTNELTIKTHGPDHTVITFHINPFLLDHTDQAVPPRFDAHRNVSNECKFQIRLTILAVKGQF